MLLGMEAPAATRPRFPGKRVLITGAGGGIGSAAALTLAAEGADLALLDRKVDLLTEIAGNCERLGAKVIALGVDQTSADEVEAGVAEACSQWDRIDGLFANAGYGQFAPFTETSLRNWQRHIDVNLNGTFYLCKAVSDRMRAAREGGSIVLNASSGATTYSDQLFAYCVSKAGVRMMANGMAAELGIHRIRVNSILPGVVESPMTSQMLADPRHRDVLVSETPIGRLGEPQDIADLVAFLLSDQSSFITGAAIAIDGGQTLHGHPRWYRLDYSTPFTDNWEIPR